MAEVVKTYKSRKCKTAEEKGIAQVEAQKKYYNTHAEERKVKARQYYADHKDEINARRRVSKKVEESEKKAGTAES